MAYFTKEFLLSSEPLNLFLLSTGFHYYFAEKLIDHLQLNNVVFAMYQPREYIEERAAEKHTVIYTDGADLATRFSKRLGKFFFARKVFKELELSNKTVHVFSPYYNDNFVNFLRGLLYKHGVAADYSIIPDGAALMRPRPLPKSNLSLIEAVFFGMSGVPPVDHQHKTGSYSDFIKTIYHFPVKKIYAPEDKVIIIEYAASDKKNNGEILVLGGLQNMTSDFVLKARQMADGYPVKFRMHPKNRNGLQYIQQHCPDWEELQLPMKVTLEEYMIEKPFYKIIGSYSSALVFNHLFISSSQSEFLIEKEDDDEDWHRSADACGIAVTFVQGQDN